MKKADSLQSNKHVLGLDLSTMNGSIRDLANQHLSSAAALDKLLKPYLDVERAAIHSSRSLMESALTAMQAQREAIALAQSSVDNQSVFGLSAAEHAYQALQDERDRVLTAMSALSAIDVTQVELAASNYQTMFDSARQALERDAHFAKATFAQSDLAARSVADVLQNSLSGLSSWRLVDQFRTGFLDFNQGLLSEIFTSIQSSSAKELARQVRDLQSSLPSSWLAMEMRSFARKPAARRAKSKRAKGRAVKVRKKVSTVRDVLTEIHAGLRTAEIDRRKDAKIAHSATRAAWIAVIVALLTLLHDISKDIEVKVKVPQQIEAPVSAKRSTTVKSLTKPAAAKRKARKTPREPKTFPRSLQT